MEMASIGGDYVRALRHHTRYARQKDKRRSFLGCLGRALLVLLIVILVLAVAGGIRQANTVARDREAYPPPGEIVDADGINMHLYCPGMCGLFVLGRAHQKKDRGSRRRVNQNICPMARGRNCPRHLDFWQSVLRIHPGDPA